MLVAGVDLGGTAVNYTLLNDREEFLDGLCEYPARSTEERPAICLKQIAEGQSGVGEDGNLFCRCGGCRPRHAGPGQRNGSAQRQGSTNFVHADLGEFRYVGDLAQVLAKPVVYLNDANAAAVSAPLLCSAPARGPPRFPASLAPVSAAESYGWLRNEGGRDWPHPLSVDSRHRGTASGV